MEKKNGLKDVDYTTVQTDSITLFAVLKGTLHLKKNIGLFSNSPS